MNIIITIILTYSIINIYHKEFIFSWLRKILKFKPFSCTRCLSVWVGIGLSFLIPTHESMIISALISACVSYMTIKVSELVTKNDIIID